MKFVKHRATTAKSKMMINNVEELKMGFYNDLVSIIKMMDIPSSLVMNWDQTGVRLVPVSGWMMEKGGSKRVEIAGTNNKEQITLVLCGTMTGDFLPPQVIYKGTTPRCQPKYSFSCERNITHSPKRWSNEETVKEYIQEIIIPYVESIRDLSKCDSLSVCIIDNFKGQITPDIIALLEEKDIFVCKLPLNSTDILQPMDLFVNKLVKDYLRKEFSNWYSNEVSQQLNNSEDLQLQPVKLSLSSLKTIGAKWLVGMVDYIQDNPKIVVNGFRISGILQALDEAYGNENETEILMKASMMRTKTVVLYLQTKLSQLL